MKCVIATGGSGGHFFPTLYVAQEFKKEGHEVYFVGAFGGFQEKIKGYDFPVRNLNAKGFTKKSLKSVVEFFVGMLQSVLASLKILKEIQPDIVCGFGSYGSFPAVFSAILLRRPTMIHEQNVKPGRANRVLFYFVNKVGVSFEATLQKFFKGEKAVVTGCPGHVRDQGLTKAQALENLGLDSQKVTILVLGGSQGSHCLNEKFVGAVPLLKDFAFQVIHLSGKNDFAELQQKYQTLGIAYRLFEFCDEMEKVYTAADLAICRSGAVTVTELAEFGLPSILVPYPHAGGHQRLNALVLVEAKLARLIEEEDLTEVKLSQMISAALTNRPDPWEFQKNRSKICIPDAARRFAREATALVKA